MLARRFSSLLLLEVFSTGSMSFLGSAIVVH